MARPRNTQYMKFWRAQAVLNEVSRPLKTERGVRSYIERARAREFLRRRYPQQLNRTIYVSCEGMPNAHRNSMTVPKGEWQEHSVARLLARVIWYRKQPYGTEEWANHGIEFCAIYLDVVQSLMGKAAADLLKNSFKANGVRFKPKKKVEVTDEMRARLAAARAKQGKNNGTQAEG